MFGASAVPVSVLPTTPEPAQDTLVAAQVTLRSPLGAVLYHTAGALIDHGWLRLYGSGGHARMAQGFREANPTPGAGFAVVAADVLGGQFALNGGALGADRGRLYYFSPDRLAWEGLEIGYSDFLEWATCAGSLQAFYGEVRWPTWEQDCAQLAGDQGILVYPFLWAEGPPISERTRRVVRVQELLSLQGDMAGQLSRPDSP